MLKPWKILVIIGKAQGGNDFVAMRLQLLCKHHIHFRSQDLDWDPNAFDLVLLEQGWMSGGNAVDQLVALGSKTEDSPAAEAKSDCSNTKVLRAQGSRAVEDLRFPYSLGVASHERWKIHFAPSTLVRDDLGRNDFAAEAVLTAKISKYFTE